MALPIHFEGQTIPEASIPLISTIFVCYSKPLFGWSRFRCQKSQFFLWTSIKTLSMQPVGPSWTVRPILKVKRAPKRAYPSFRWFLCAVANHFLGDPDKDVKNAKYFCGCPSIPCLCIRLALTARLTNFEGQTSPEASIPLILTIFVCYSTPFFGWSGFRYQKCQIFSWTSVKTLSMQTVGHHGLSDPFGGSNKPRSEHTPHFDDFRVL